MHSVSHKNDVFYCLLSQAWLNNDIIYLAVGEDYEFEANATQGTNASVLWTFEPTVSFNDTYPGEFTYASRTHRFVLLF